MHNRPPVAFGARAAAGGLTLAVHGLLMLVLLVEDRDLLRPLPPARKLVGIWIHLPARAIRPEPAGIAEPGTPVPAIAPAALRPRAAITLAPAPQAAPEAADEPGVPPRIDWELAAQRLAAGAREDPVTFSPPPETMRRPCRPRSYDAATTAMMDELQPPPRDLPVGGGSSQKSVQMGGVRVGIITLVPGRGHTDTGEDVSKSSFKWKWDYRSTGGSAALTLGWEPPPKYDGMFDDMKAGKTPDSSVPDPDVCD